MLAVHVHMLQIMRLILLLLCDLLLAGCAHVRRYWTDDEQ
jgi:hypothetical protein